MAYGASRGRANTRSASQRRRKKRRRKGQLSIVKLVIAVLILAAIVLGVVFGIKAIKGKAEEPEIETQEPESMLEKSVKVDGVTITDMGKTQARVAIEKKYSWSMKAKLAGGTPADYDISNLLEYSINKKLDEIYDTEEPQEDYKIEFEISDTELDAEIENMKSMWNREAKNGSVIGYDKATEAFTYGGEENGLAIDEEKLRNDIREAFAAGKYNASIDVSAEVVKPEIDEAAAKAMYTTIGTFTTNSTNNADRNSNLNLACNAIDGILLQVGEQFSFNLTTGNRTPEKGYKEAAAYNNGEVVSEPGGGVCQVASTLYNALIKAGLEADERHPHTYAPTYVTPGEDATVSYDGYSGPDLKFTNTTSAALVIRAHYQDRTVRCWIIGIPILGEGEEISLHSEKTGTSPVPEPTYEDNPELAPGVQVTVTKGDEGSTWRTYKKHVYPDGRVEDNYLRDTRYKGHTPKVQRNMATWKDEYQNPPTDAEGNPLPLIQMTNDEGEVVYAYETQPPATATDETTAGGPGVSTGEAGGPGVPKPTEAEEPETEAEGPAAPEMIDDDDFVPGAPIN